MSHTLGSIDDENLRRDDGDFSCGIGTGDRHIDAYTAEPTLLCNF